MTDNKTPHSSQEYDRQIEKTIPHYKFFHEETIDLIKTANSHPATWLDTGGGTGVLVQNAVRVFKDTHFVLADPSAAMLKIAREKLLHNDNIDYLLSGTQNLEFPVAHFDVITAIQSHHYMELDTRKRAIANCFRMLRHGGVFVTFENIKPNTDKGIEISLKRWESYQLLQGKTEAEVAKHIERFGIEYFPISMISHFELLYDTGFAVAEVLWASSMQAGFYAIKR